MCRACSSRAHTAQMQFSSMCIPYSPGPSTPSPDSHHPCRSFTLLQLWAVATLLSLEFDDCRASHMWSLLVFVLHLYSFLRLNDGVLLPLTTCWPLSLVSMRVGPAVCLTGPGKSCCICWRRKRSAALACPSPPFSIHRDHCDDAQVAQAQAAFWLPSPCSAWGSS